MKLAISHISKTYKKGGVKALDDFCAVLTPGVYGFLGPNGAGKSTLMNIITDNLVPDQGEVLLDGENTRALGKDFRAKVGYMPQQQGLYDDFSAVRFLWYMAAVKGIPRKEAKPRIEQLLALVNLDESAHKKLGTFSGGMKQRILIAQALLNDPDILILDEPTAGLDPKERIRIRNFISEIAQNKIVILATHVVSDVEFIAKEIMLIKKGKLLMLDTPAHIISDMAGKVFVSLISLDELPGAQKQYRISNIVNESDQIGVRIVSDTVPKYAKTTSVNPTLEDVYLYYFADDVIV